MDRLLKVALAGTARAGGDWAAGGTPADAPVASLTEESAERRLLLAAGARAVYRRAGVAPAIGAALPAAPDDPAPICARGSAGLIASLLAGEHREVLPEAIERLGRSGRRLPHALLPAALEAGTHTAALRPALLAAIGARGRWLAAQHGPWRWATALPESADAPPADAEAIWEEGTPAQRLAILRRVRAHDPARGRDLLAATWRGEKADFRTEAIGAFDVGLSPDDEPFLDAALDDRSQGVRAGAARLLARLPESALAARLRERADPCLQFTPGLLAGGFRAAAKALVRGASGGKLSATPPLRFDDTWARDGLVAKPPQGTGERAWWLQQLLALVPPSHWSKRFAADLATLLAAAERGDWAAALLEGWGQAAILHRDAAWAAALCRHWGAAKLDRVRQHATGRLLGDLVGCLPPAAAEAVARDALGRVADPDYRWLTFLERLPRPWSAAFGTAALERLSDHLRDATGGNRYDDFWLNALPTIALALPRECFAPALAIKPPPADSANPAAGWIGRQLDTFGATIRLRRRLMEEIPL